MKVNVKKLTLVSALVGAGSLLCSCSSPSAAPSVQTPISVQEQQLLLANKIIPAGCVAQLMTELNGDDVQGAVFLTDTAWRGCLRANVPFNDTIQSKYRVINQVTEQDFTIRACQSVDGSMGHYCDSFSVTFEQWPYTEDGTTTQVWVMRKTGTLE